MLNSDITRAWKDEDYSSSLSEEQRSQLPENPVGTVELSDADMEIVAGGGGNFCGAEGACDWSIIAGCNLSFNEVCVLPGQPAPEPEEPPCVPNPNVADDPCT